MKSFEVKEFKKLALRLEVKDNSLASENFADVAAARGIVYNFSNFSNSQFSFCNFSNFSNFSFSTSRILEF